MREFDAIVIGVGGMGSATVYHLARRGWKVLGLEQYDIPNEMGSSHGVSRMIRLAYHEDPSYVPLLYRAYELWHQLENVAGEKLLVTTGCVRGGVGTNRLLEGSLATVQEHHLPYRMLSGPEVNREWPGYQLPEDAEMLYEQQGGFVLSERCIVSHVSGALEMGAEVHGREAAVDWEPTAGGGVVVTTDKDTYTARRLLVTAGAWAGKVAPAVAEHAVPERQVLGWFAPYRPELFKPETFPVFGMEVEEGRFYGFPSYGITRVSSWGCSTIFASRWIRTTMDREPNARDEAALRQFTERYFPEAAGPTLALKTCMFTNTPDEHFIIDTLGEHPQVSVAAGFSGHGFKFCSVVGEIMADLAEHGTTDARHRACSGYPDLTARPARWSGCWWPWEAPSASCTALRRESARGTLFRGRYSVRHAGGERGRFFCTGVSGDRVY